MILPKIVVLASLAVPALAIGRAIVTNQCDDTIYLWAVGSSIGPQIILPKDSSYGETFTSDSQSGDVSLKITRNPDGLFAPNNSQLIFAYNIDNQDVRYNISSIFGNAFYGRKLKIQPSDEACDSIVWNYGQIPAGSQTKICQRETNLELTFCTGHCLPSWYPCGKSAPNDARACCTHCIGSHHCVAPI